MIKPKFRRFAALLSALVLTLSLTACHGSKGLAAFEMPEEFDTEKTYEITFWGKNDTNMTQRAIYEDTVARFEALYPNIKVNLRLYTDYSKIYNDVITNISTGTTPNVCITYPDHIATYITGTNVVVPLDDLMEDEKYGLGGSELRFDSPEKEEIVSQFLAECSLEGTCYALPYMRSTEALYINKTFVEKLGYTVPDVPTWDWIWEVCEAALAQDEDGTYLLNGQKVMIPLIYKSTDNMMIQMLRQLNAGYSTEDGDILIFNETTGEILKQLAVLGAEKAFSTFKISSYPGNFLNAGQAVFGIDSTAGATWMGSEAANQDIAQDSIVEFETVVRPIPQYDPENPVMISQGPSVCIFNKQDSGEVLASWLFAQFLLNDETQIAYAQTEGYVPVTTKAQSTDEYQDYLARSGEDNDLYYSIKIDATKLLIDNTENTFTTPVFNGSASLRDAAGQMIENVVKAGRRGDTVDDAYIESLYQRMNSLYRLDQHGDSVGGKEDLGELPTEAKILLGCLLGAWVLIGLYSLSLRIKKKRAAASGKQ